MVRIVLLLGIVLSLSGCTPGDASLKDLKSPCAANELDISALEVGAGIAPNPCIRRNLVENYYTV
jgi:hypothetical protein